MGKLFNHIISPNATLIVEHAITSESDNYKKFNYNDNNIIKVNMSDNSKIKIKSSDSNVLAYFDIYDLPLLVDSLSEVTTWFTNLEKNKMIYYKNVEGDIIGLKKGYSSSFHINSGKQVFHFMPHLIEDSLGIIYESVALYIDTDFLGEMTCTEFLGFRLALTNYINNMSTITINLYLLTMMKQFFKS